MKPGIVRSLASQRGRQPKPVACNAFADKTLTPCNECGRCKRRHSIRAWQQRNREKAKAATKNWAVRNPEKMKAGHVAWKRANPEASSRARHLREYNLTAEEYADMFTRQNGRCAMSDCRRAFDGSCRPNVDHCHATGAVRGILCSGCNTRLGFFEKSRERYPVFALYAGVHNFDYVWDLA